MKDQVDGELPELTLAIIHNLNPNYFHKILLPVFTGDFLKIRIIMSFYENFTISSI
jgi:hypothetical protein